MNIYVLTQEDAFYIPLVLDHLFSRRGDVVGLGIVPGELRGKNFTRYLRMMGWRDFTLQSLNLVRHRLGDAMARIGVPTRRSYSVAGAARNAGIDADRVDDVNDPEFLDHLRDLGVEVIVSVACPQRLRRNALELPAHGCINLHGSMLPRYQGLLPSFWVLANGEDRTGVTVHYMAEEIDAGDVILQQAVEIRPKDTVHELVRRSKVGVGRELLVRALDQIERGTVMATPMSQSDASYHSFPTAAAVAEFRRRGRRFI